jgi:hypothetical protein
MIPVLLLLAALQAPTDTLGVRVILARGADTVAVANAPLRLHRVTATVQGVTDSTVAAADGTARFRLPADTGGVWLVSARWAGIEYFGAPVDPQSRTRSVTILVADTSSSAPVTIAARHLIIGSPAPDGTRDVVDLVILRNAGAITRAVADSSIPTFTLPLPATAANRRVGDADFAPEALDLHGDTLFVHAPIPPGDRQFFLEYQLPPGTRRLAIPMGNGVGVMSVLGEEAGLRLPASFGARGPETVEGRTFQRWSADSGVASGDLEIVFPGSDALPDWVLPAIIATFGVGLSVLLLRRRRPLAGRPADR